MSDQPYPAGTRVVLTWHETPSAIGRTGTCTQRTCVAQPGERYFDTAAWRVTEHAGRAGMLEQVVIDDGDGVAKHWPVAWLRPLSDPDADLKIEEKEKESVCP